MLSFVTGGKRVESICAGYDQHIDDWILWLPTAKGFFLARKHGNHGVEAQVDLAVVLAKELNPIAGRRSTRWRNDASPADQLSASNCPMSRETSL